MGTLLQLSTEVKNPSSSRRESYERMKRVLASKPSARQIRERQEWYDKLNHNIDYYKKHGKLPNNVDMDKVNGKGDAYARNRG